jgi:hypothetical protein
MEELHARFGPDPTTPAPAAEAPSGAAELCFPTPFVGFGFNRRTAAAWRPRLPANSNHAAKIVPARLSRSHEYNGEQKGTKRESSLTHRGRARLPPSRAAARHGSRHARPPKGVAAKQDILPACVIHFTLMSVISSTDSTQIKETRAGRLRILLHPGPGSGALCTGTCSCRCEDERVVEQPARSGWAAAQT